jgi:hypothetical protein
MVVGGGGGGAGAVGGNANWNRRVRLERAEQVNWSDITGSDVQRGGGGGGGGGHSGTAIGAGQVLEVVEMVG